MVEMEREEVEFDMLRILDFYFVFPQLLSSVRLSNSGRSKLRRLTISKNKYTFSSGPELVFTQMAPLQRQAIWLLQSAGIVSVSSPPSQNIRMTAPIPSEVGRAIERRHSQYGNLLSFLTRELGQMSLHGNGGLKDRSGLMEYRYDPV
jgi:hypothetical protein